MVEFSLSCRVKQKLSVLGISISHTLWFKEKHSPLQPVTRRPSWERGEIPVIPQELSRGEVIGFIAPRAIILLIFSEVSQPGEMKGEKLILSALFQILGPKLALPLNLSVL